MAELKTLPPEMLIMIFNWTEPEDYLAIKLTCKTFNGMLSDDLTTFLLKHDHSEEIRDEDAPVGPDRWGYYLPANNKSLESRRLPYFEFISAHARVEGNCGIRKPTGDCEHLLCTACRQLKPRRMFMDARVNAFPRDMRMHNVYRIYHRPHHATLCKLRPCIPCTPENSIKATVLVEGQKMFVCEKCHEPHPFSKRVFMRKTKHGSICQGCADQQHLGYAPRKGQPGYVVYDEMISVEDILRDVASGRIKVDSNIRITGLSE